MAGPNFIASKCPTCGASLDVPPGAPQVVCRYCNNVIQIQRQKPPPNVMPFGPGAMPSTTLYIDPDIGRAAAQAGKTIGIIILVSVALPILIPIFIFVVPLLSRSIKGAVKPFPVECELNEVVEVSGNFEGTGPLVTATGHNCKLHIKDSKLKGATLLKTDASNVEITLDNVTIETTDTLLKAGTNTKLRIHKSTLVSAGTVFESESNLELKELTDSTIESKGGTAIKTKYNLKVHAENTKIRGKKAAVDADSSFELSLKKGSEVTSSDGVAIKASSSLKIEAEGGKIDGAEGAIVSTSGTNIEGHGLILSSAKESAIQTTSGVKLDLTDGSITAAADSAVTCDGGDLTFINVKVQGVDNGLVVKNGGKIKASKKTRIVGTNGYGILATSNTELTFNDAALEGGTRAFKGTVNTKIKLAQGARLAGKKGGIDTEGNFELDGTGAVIDGGTGPGIAATYNPRITLRQGSLKGVPALQTERKPLTLDLDGTRVDGEQKIPAR